MNRLLHSSFIMLVLAIVLYAAMALYGDGALVWQAITSLDGTIWFAILALSLGNYLLRYWRWHCYISHGASYDLGHLKHLAIYLSGFSLTMTPGKAGEAMRSLYLKQHDVPHSRSLGALFVERIMDLFAILIMACCGFFVVVGNNATAQFAVLLMFAAMFAAIIVVKIPRQKIMASKLVRSLPQKLREAIFFVGTTLDSARYLLSLRFLLLGLTLGVVAWGLEGYGLYLVMQQYQPDTTTIALAMAIYGLGILLGALSMSPAGLGASEIAMTSLLVMAGFDMPSAIAITYICRLATLWFAVLIGLVCLLVMYGLGIKPQLPKGA